MTVTAFRIRLVYRRRATAREIVAPPEDQPTSKQRFSPLLNQRLGDEGGDIDDHILR